MKILKYIAFVLGGIAALAVVLAVVLALTFDAQRIKAELTRVVQEQKQRALSIEGDLALFFWPGIGLDLGRTTLSERNSEQPFLSVERARVTVALLPLLSKQLVVDQIRLDGVDAIVIRKKDGSFNFDDLLAKQEKQAEAVRFDIAGIRIDKSRVAFRDDKSGQSFALSELNLTTGRLGSAAEGSLGISGRLKGTKPEIDAQVRASGRYRYDLGRRDYRVSDLQAGLAGTLATIQGFDATLDVDRAELRPDPLQLRLDKLQVVAKGKSDADSFEVKLAAPQFVAAQDKASGQAIIASLNLRGAQRTADAKLNLSGVEGTVNALKVSAARLDLDAKQGDLSIRGGIASPLEADLAGQALRLSKFAGEFNVAHPQMPMKGVKLPVTGNVQADLIRASASGELSSRFDESSIAATWSVPKFAPLAVQFALEVDRINVDKYFPPKPAGGQAAAGGPAAAEKPFDFSGLKHLNASASVKIGWLQFQNVKASNIRLVIRADQGKLEANPVSASLYEGSLAGSMSLNAHSSQVALKQNLSGVDINPLLKDIAGKDMLEGRGNVSLDVATGGNTVSAMKRRLNGAARVNLRDGAFRGINLAQTIREVRGVLGARQDTVRRADATQKTDFTELRASFRIAEGVARNDDLMAKSPLLRLSGAGEIDIPRNSMNYLLKTSVVAASIGQVGKELADVHGVTTVPVRVTGPFDNLSYQLDLANLATDVARSKLEAAVGQQLQKKVPPSLQDSLKALLGR